ncbi:MAG: M20/M25/M40 family metallo-hydrolase [SAR202 cluster bacterium]|nr:M20/M25/M40 family metallo-hydrolase [SAR202 cluster bacterium]
MGNEVQCIEHIKALLDDAGIQNQALAKASGLPNPIAWLSGDGIAGPLLLQDHIYVVLANPERWRHPPFGGDLVDGFPWEWGSLDMKGVIAMMLHAILRAKTDGMASAGDIVLALVSDDESGGDQGGR